MPANFPTRRTVSDAHAAWEESMLRQVETLRAGLRARSAQQVALLCGASLDGEALNFSYWGQPVRVLWPALEPCRQEDGSSLPLNDQALLLYYLHTADGAAVADRWASFRELPGGGFYFQAFQGYSGDLLAKAFAAELPGGKTPEDFRAACQNAGGWALEALSPYAFAFDALPKIRLAAVLWPGDEDFPTKAGILFDASSTHYLPIDGMAMLGSKLARHILRS